jgi:microcystin degradation protein MlrC
MRCVIALMQHETNTFSPVPTTLADFATVIGLNTPPSQSLAREKYGHAQFAFSAMIDEAELRGAEISIPIAAYAEPSAKMDTVSFDTIAKAICDDIQLGCDAVLLDLHGAMVTESSFDGEGELLKRIREVDAHVPIAVALDFHTNLTQAMVDNATVIDGYRTYPHIDMYETGQRAARSLFQIIDAGRAVKTRWKSMPMMTHMILQTPAKQPMKDIMDRAIKAVDDSDVLNASVFGGFPLADIPHVSLSALTVEFEDSNNGPKLVSELCNLAWDRREDFVYNPETYEESVLRAKSLNDYPVVIADHGDNCASGGSADDLSVLAEMIDQGLDEIIAGPICDPETVQLMIEAGVGSEVSLSAAGKTDVEIIGQFGKSLEITGTISKITDGKFIITGPMQTGLEVNLGPTAVIKNDQVALVLCGERWEPYDLGCFTHADLDPLKSKYILIKSRQHFRAGFEDLASHIILAAGPGVCSSDYSQFNFKNLIRPIFPLDRDFEN